MQTNKEKSEVKNEKVSKKKVPNRKTDKSHTYTETMCTKNNKHTITSRMNENDNTKIIKEN